MREEDEIHQECMKELAEAKESLQHFTYTVSHDLGAPIRSVVSFAHLLLQHGGASLDEKSKHYLSFIVSGGEKAQAMLAGLLDYSRLNTRPRKLTLTNTEKIVVDCLADLREKIELSNAEIDVGSLPEIIADADQLHQLFYNLLDNALKFYKADEVPKIKIHAERVDDGWKFMVEDKGIGIEERFTDEIFNIYRRLHREDEFPGNGIGLALAKKIVELQGGSIGVNSTPGVGSSFYFILKDEKKSNWQLGNDLRTANA